MTKIAENTTPRVRSSRSKSSASAVTPDLGIDAARFLSTSAAPSAVYVDMNRGVVTPLGQRRRAAPHLSIVEVARDAHVTLTRAIALRARVAATPEDMAAAKHLVRRRYAWRGYDVPMEDHQSLRAALDPDARELVLVVADGDTIIGTVTMGFDGADGLLAESSYPDEIDDERAAGSRLCEVTRLAVAEQADSKPALAALFALLLAIGRARHVTHMFIEVNPRHVVFYRRVLGFHIAGGERLCERAKAPSVLLCVDMDEFERKVRGFNAKVGSDRLEARAA